MLMGSRRNTKLMSQGSYVQIDLNAREITYTFQLVAIDLQETNLTNVFARKNNKTLAQTIEHRRYLHLATRVREQYADMLDEPIGRSLLRLKTSGDPFYLRFLNTHGDKTYCRFSIDGFREEKGVYAWFAGQQLRYIGRSLDSFSKRVNQGYGIISPKNCFLDGQSTNCHLNSLIASSVQDISLFVCPIESDQEICEVERDLILQYQPQWNTVLVAR